MKTFDEYWEQYGELHASMCGGDIKLFAKEIWKSAVEASAAMLADKSYSCETCGERYEVDQEECIICGGEVIEED